MLVESITGIARVVAVIGDDAFLRMPDGTNLTAAGGASAFELDAAYFINSNRASPGAQITRAPESAWPIASEMGVVAEVEKDLLWIRKGDVIFSSTNKTGEKVKKGWTVEYRPGGISTRVIHRKRSKVNGSPLDADVDQRTGVKRFRRTPDSTWPTVEDFVGAPQIVRQARDLIELPFKSPALFSQIGAPMIKGVLFAGPPGTGKTLLARIIAAEVDAALYVVNGADVGDMFYGNSEKTVQNIFKAAARDKKGRAIIFFDELDSIAPPRGPKTHEVDRRVVTALLTSMDGVDKNPNVTVIATTNRPQDLDEALTRLGRFDRIIDFPLPTESQRHRLLLQSGQVINKGAIDYVRFASMTDQWSGAELAGVWREAQLLAVRDGRGQIIDEDFARGVELVAEQRALRVRELEHVHDQVD